MLQGLAQIVAGYLERRVQSSVPQKNEGNRVAWNFPLRVKNRKEMSDSMKFSIAPTKGWFIAITLPVGQADCVSMFCPN